MCFCSPSYPTRLICIPDEELKGIQQMKLEMLEGLARYSSHIFWSIVELVRPFPNRAQNDLNLPPVRWRDMDEQLTPTVGDRIGRAFVGEPRISHYQGLRAHAEGETGRRAEDFLQHEQNSVTQFDDIDGYMLSGEIITSPFNSSLWASEVLTRIVQAD